MGVWGKGRGKAFFQRVALSPSPSRRRLPYCINLGKNVTRPGKSIRMATHNT